MKKFLPEVTENETYNEILVEKNENLLPETSFDNVTVDKIERYYRKALRRGAVYFVGYDNDDDSEKEPEKRSVFVTGDILNQLTTIALKFGGVVYQLNDDYYIVRSGSAGLMDNYKTSSVFVSSMSTEDIDKMLTLYKLEGQTLGLQTVARGSLLNLVEFQSVFKTLNDNKSVYLIDLAFIDFSVEESVNFQAYLLANPVNLLEARTFEDLFSIYLDCSIDNLRSRNFYSQSLLASDGNTSKFDVGTKHTREQRSISDMGTSTVSGYDSIEDGLQLTFTPKTCLDNRVICTVELENSAFTDESYNTKTETTINVAEVPFELGKTYFLSSLTNIAKARNIVFLGIKATRNNRAQTCWTRVRKIK